ncbi:MAG: diaminopimelate epimerase [Bacteroidales bacterium]
MTIPFHKYQGAGNDFIILDGMQKANEPDSAIIKKLCDRRFGVGADGLMIILPSDKADFHMKYWNADGKEGSLCGNGGRCIVRFAHDRNYTGKTCLFTASDGEHRGEIDGEIVYLQMQTVKMPDDPEKLIIDTGSPHIVVPVEGIDGYDVVGEGRRLRFSDLYKPGGTNVNFLQEISTHEIRQRTYERGVEDETLACGTGAVAGALYQAWRHNIDEGEIIVHMPGGKLKVSFARNEKKFVNLKLSGPAKFVFSGQAEL